MKVNALKGDWIEAFPNRFPRFAAVHQRSQLSVSVRSQCSRSSQQLGSQAARCLARELADSLPLCLFKDSFEVRDCAKRINRVLVTVIKPLWNRTEDGMF